MLSTTLIFIILFLNIKQLIIEHIYSFSSNEYIF